MRIALLYGPTAAGFPPVGALTLSAIAKRMGVATEVVPLPAAQRRAEVAEALAGFDMVGFSTDCGTYPDAVLTARALRAARPDLPIVFGGPQATVTATQTMQAFPEVDLCVKGEAEQSFPELLRRLATGAEDWREVPGGVWRAGDGIESLPEPAMLADVDQVPLPDYAAFPTVGINGSIPLEVGRGCPYGCTFCSTNTFFKRRFRMKSSERVAADVASLTASYGVRHVDFIHDMFTVRRDFVEDICAAMARLPVSWNCSARTDRLDDALLSTMADAGCVGVYVGIETGSKRLQRSLKKNLNVDEAIAMVRRCQNFGIGVTASMIIGYPNETVEDLRETLLCAFELVRPHPSRQATGDVVLQLPFFAPLAGTPILDEASGFAFDGVPPSVVELGESQELSPEARALVEAHPGIFLAHYHPTGTEIARADYIVLMHVTSELTNMPEVMRHLAEREAKAFVDFLLRPGIARHRGPTQAATTAAVMEAFQSRPHARLSRGTVAAARQPVAAW
ncbi:MAG: radical SAM protein [Rhodobacter sp.]|nr:radical SAM protein [Rhodobacter sp.]